MTTIENMAIANRETAGCFLGKKLHQYDPSSAIVLGIPRGGIVVAASVAEHLGMPLFVLPCRKLVHPADNERSIGSVSIEDVALSTDCHDIPWDYIAHQIKLTRNGLKNELSDYNYSQCAEVLRGKTIIIVDDISRSGDTILACVKSIRKYQPLKIIVAVPYVSAKAAASIEQVVDELVFLRADHDLKFATDFYNDFPDVSIQDVREKLLCFGQQMSV